MNNLYSILFNRNSKYLFILFLVFISCSSDRLVIKKLNLDYSLSQYSNILGKVSDNNNGEALIGVEVLLSDNKSNKVYETKTDIDGNFTFPNVISGTYNIKLQYIGYETEQLNNVQLDENFYYQINVKLNPSEFNFSF